MRLISEKDRAILKKRVLRAFILYALAVALFLGGALCLLFFSRENYLPFMIADILLTSAFGVFSVYFFSAEFRSRRKKLALVDKVLAAREDDEFAVFLLDGGVKTFDGAEVHSYEFSVSGEEREYKSILPLSLDREKTYRVISAAGVIVGSEEANEV